MHKISLRMLALIALLCLPALSLAQQKRLGNESRQQCVALIKECFAYAGVERSNCFHAAGTHSLCGTNDLGKLALQRWSMSTERSPGLDSAPALLGPNFVDASCVTNFDAQWSSALVKGDITVATLKALNQSLSSCTRVVSEDLMRP